MTWKKFTKVNGHGAQTFLLHSGRELKLLKVYIQYHQFKVHFDNKACFVDWNSKYFHWCLHVWVCVYLLYNQQALSEQVSAMFILWLGLNDLAENYLPLKNHNHSVLIVISLLFLHLTLGPCFEQQVTEWINRRRDGKPYGRGCPAAYGSHNLHQCPLVFTSHDNNCIVFFVWYNGSCCFCWSWGLGTPNSF